MSSLKNLTTKFVAPDNELLAKLSEINNTKYNIKAAHDCVDSCIKNYSKADLLGEDRVCVKSCLFNHHENSVLGKITK